MGLIDRLADALSTGDREVRSDDVEYQCSACGAVFGTAHGSCPRCGAADVRERSSVELAPEGRESTAMRE